MTATNAQSFWLERHEQPGHWLPSLQLLQWQQPLGSGADGGPCNAGKLQDQSQGSGQGNGKRVAADLPFLTRTGCLRARLLQNRLPEPELRLGGFAGRRRFASINGPGQFGMAPISAASAGGQNTGLFGDVALPGGSLLGHRGAQHGVGSGPGQSERD